MQGDCDGARPGALARVDQASWITQVLAEHPPPLPRRSPAAYPPAADSTGWYVGGSPRPGVFAAFHCSTRGLDRISLRVPLRCDRGRRVRWIKPTIRFSASRTGRPPSVLRQAGRIYRIGGRATPTAGRGWLKVTQGRGRTRCHSGAIAWSMSGAAS